MKARVHEILRDECGLEDHSRVIVAVSGGPDSICLLDLVSKLPFQITVGHLNHNLRPEADEEAAYVKTLAESRGIPVFIRSTNVMRMVNHENLGIETAARKARYKFLFEAAEQSNSQAVITAHHADDQVETILMNFIRGSGLKGLTGMPYCQRSPFNENIPLIRPLLDFWKEDILAYCHENNLTYFLDQSNLNSLYFRNKVRNHLLPLFRECNPNFKETLLRNRNALAGDMGFIRACVESEKEKLEVKKKPGQLSFSLAEFSDIPDALQNYVLMDLIQGLHPEWTDISFDLVESARSALKEHGQISSLLLEKNIHLLIEDGRAAFTSDPALVWKEEWPKLGSEKLIRISEGTLDLSDKWSMDLKIYPMQAIKADYKTNPDAMLAYLDRADLGDEISVRTWKLGDVYQPLGMGGQSVKLSDFWINRKIPKRAKERWPIIEADGQIAWVPGFQPSHIFRVKESTREILILRMRRKV